MDYFGDQILNGNLKSRTDIDRFGLIILFRGQHYATGRIIDIQEFARRFSRAPDFDLFAACLDRISAFFDQRKGKAKTSEGEYEIPKYVNDIVSALYFARTFDYSKLKADDRVHLKNFYKDTATKRKISKK